MRLRHLCALTAAVVLFAWISPAAAQSRQPGAGSAALGADAGLCVGADEFHVGFAPSVSGEYYVADRLSLRVLGGWSRNEFIDQDARYLEQLRASANLVYNFEYGVWHPYVTAGVSGHRLRTLMDDVEDSGWSSKFGVNAGVGVEYFARPTVSVKVEGAFYLVRQGDLAVEPSGAILSIGLKKYF